MTHDERQDKPSASGAYIWFNCAGSLKMQKGMTDKPSAEAIQGQEIAEAMASGEFDGLDEDGRTISQRLQWMHDKALAQWGGTNPKMLKEVRLWLYGDDDKPIISAKPDMFAVGENGRGAVIDDKSGYLPVTPAAQNIQLRIQALCLQWEHGVNEVFAAIAHYRFKEAYSVTIYGPRDLEMARKELDFRLWLTEQPDPPLNPGDWCRYCKARGVCQSAAAWSLLPVTTVSTSPVTRDEAKALARKLTPAQMAVLRRHKPIIEAIMESVDDALREMPIEELNKVGLTLGKPARVLAYEDAAMVQELLVKAGLMTREEFAGCVKVVMGRVQDLVLDKFPGTIDKAKKELQTILAPAATEHFRTAPLKALKESNE